MSSWSLKAGFGGVAVIAATAFAMAQMPDHAAMHGKMGESPKNAMEGKMPDGIATSHPTMRLGLNGEMTGAQVAGQPTMPGQEAFGTIQEVVRLLEADPTTDWSKVNIGALREHLIDMDEVTMRAMASERQLENGVEILITGQDRTLAAIKRMVPAHVQELGLLGWAAQSEDLPNGVKLSIVSTDPKQVTKLKALGFMGIMVQGSHHQLHHLMMAKGEFAH
ncbi:hypothetical protein BH11PSE4_BH11PSE4_26050 [soil metagenome]